MISILKKRATLWTLSFLLLIDISYIFYHIQQKKDTTTLLVAVLFFGLLLGALLVTIFNSDKKRAQPTLVRESSHTILSSVQKVFKIVTSEGLFNEIYDYKETKKLWKILPSTKKALVIIKGKAQMGYDFAKCQWKVDEETKTITLVSFPAPEILSLETDFEYYNLEEKFYDLFSKEDLANIQRDGKKQIAKAVMQSHLPETAAEQIEVVLRELIHARGWEIKNLQLINDSVKKIELAPEKDK